MKFNIAPEKLPAQLESSPSPHFSGATKKFRARLRTNFTQAFGPPQGLRCCGWTWLLLAASLFWGYQERVGFRDSPPLQNFVTGKCCQKFVEGSPSIFGGGRCFFWFLFADWWSVISIFAWRYLRKINWLHVRHIRSSHRMAEKYMCQGRSTPYIGHKLILPSIGNPYIINPTKPLLGWWVYPMFNMEIHGSGSTLSHSEKSHKLGCCFTRSFLETKETMEVSLRVPAAREAKHFIKETFIGM